MNLETKSHELAKYLQSVKGELVGIDKDTSEVCDDLSPQEAQVLLTLDRKGRCIMGDIADAIKLSLSSVTGLIDKLEGKKFVRRERSAEDRRIVQAELTDEGRKMQKLTADAYDRFARGLLKALSPEEQDQFLALFRKIAASLESKEVEA